jgi:hypothetical protein
MHDFVRIIENFVARLDGPLHFRFIFQPLMAIFLAIRDGRRDASEGKSPYRLFTEPGQRGEVLRSGWQSAGKVFVIALILDAVYQSRVLARFYPGEALLVALVLAVVPYFFVRGPVNQLMRRKR